MAPTETGAVNMEYRLTEVRFYSGQTHTERPLSLVWDGAEVEVRSVESEWREYGEKCFRVRAGDDRLFVLRYNEHSDEWSAFEIAGDVITPSQGRRGGRG